MLCRELPQNEQCNHDDFWIQHKTDADTKSMAAPHFHDYFEIYYVRGGKKEFFVGNRMYLLQKGDMVVVPPYELHKNVRMESGRYEGVLLYFSSTFLFDGEEILKRAVECLADSSSRLFRLDKCEQKNVESILEKMRYEYKGKQPGRRLFLRTLLCQWLIFLYRKLVSDGSPVFPHISSLHQKVSEIAQYIERHYAEPLSLGAISRHFSISTYYLCRIFKETSGFSINEYLNAIRLREAQKLLRNTNLPVIRVSEMAGFGSISNFGRVFKNYYGVSPLQYRKYL